MKSLLLTVFSLFILQGTAQEKKAEYTSQKQAEELKVQSANAQSLAKVEAKKLTKQLNLTSVQQNSVYEVYLDHFKAELKMKQKVKSMMTSENRKNKKETVKILEEQKLSQAEKLNSRLKSILTPDQFKTFQEINP